MRLHGKMREITEQGIFYLVLIYLITDCNTLSIGSVRESDDQVTAAELQSRESQQDLFPDWVPFKNKHGDELGEFKQVPKKMPKKRLALPMNFRLKAVAEPDGDDYYEKGGGDSEEDYEKKEWSDTNRPEKFKLDVHHTDLSDIKGVVNIIKNTGKPSNNHKSSQEVPEKVSSSEDYGDKNNSGDNTEKIQNVEIVEVQSGEEKEIKQPPIKVLISGKETKADTDNKNNNNTIHPNNKKKHGDSSAGEIKDSSSETKIKEIKSDEEVNEYDDTPDEVKKPVEKQKLVTEDESDYVETKPELKNNKEEKAPDTTEEDKENEAKKAFILGAVDDLKERHAEEQRLISERVKEEERLADDNGYEKHGNVFRKYNERYQKPNRKTVRYEENDYEDSRESHSVEDKYKIKPRPRVSTRPHNTYYITTRKTPQAHYIPDKQNDAVTGKPSVFRNPQIYMVNDYDEDIEMTTQNYRRRKTTGKETEAKNDKKKNADSEERVRISLVPESDDENGRPALFFPRVKPRRSKNKSTTTTPKTEKVADATAADSVPSVMDTAPSNLFTGPSSIEASPTTTGISSTGSESSAETGPSAIETAPSADAVSSAESTKSDTASSEVSSPETAPPGDASETAPSGVASETAPSAVEGTAAGSGVSAADANQTVATGPSASSSNADPVLDTMPAPTEHKKAPHKKEHHHHEHEGGGGKEFHAENEEEHGEHGKKWYKGEHKEAKAAKGHHDKEDHHGSYADHGGHEKKHHAESGHYGDHHHEETGKKHAKYEESGKHTKGHSTKGSHDVHKKEEYEKKVEFFEEEGDTAEEEKHGGFNKDHEHKKGGKFHESNIKAGHQAHHKGDKGHFEKSGHGLGHKGHKSSGGHDSHGRHGQAHFHDEGKQSGKKWIYHQGYPAKTASLHVIDRADLRQHGPTYYG